MACARVFAELRPDRSVTIDGVPEYAGLEVAGVGAYLRPVTQ